MYYLRYYREHTSVQNHAPLEELDLALNEQIVVGTFVDEQRPTFLEALESVFPKAAAVAGS